MKDFGEVGMMVEGDERRKSVDEGGVEGVEMMIVDLLFLLLFCYVVLESFFGVWLVVE